MITKRLWVFALALWLVHSSCSPAFAQTLGPVSSYEELSSAAASAQSGDTILLSGEIFADSSEPLSSSAFIHLKSETGAVVRGLHLQDAVLSLTGIALEDGLIVDGTSQISLGSGVTVSGTDGSAALSFSGNGALIVERGCKIEGGTGAAGISISHNGGEFYSSIEGIVTGGDGSSGGAGMIVSPLKEGGAVMITGSIKGGSGTSVGGHALNLYDLSGNAYITVGGTLQGGDGPIGGDGIQLVSASDNVSVGISGQVKGGQGESYGGNALILMNAVDASSVNLSGHFSGGDVIGDSAQPGTSLNLVGDSASLRTRIDNCILEDGRQLGPVSEPQPLPDVTEPPEITGESIQAGEAFPTELPAETESEPKTDAVLPPDITVPSDNTDEPIQPDETFPAEIVPEPEPEPDDEHQPDEPLPESTPEPLSETSVDASGNSDDPAKQTESEAPVSDEAAPSETAAE